MRKNKIAFSKLSEENSKTKQNKTTTYDTSLNEENSMNNPLMKHLKITYIILKITDIFKNFEKEEKNGKSDQIIRKHTQNSSGKIIISDRRNHCIF